MSGWIPTPAAGWPVTLERLQRLGEPLTESEAITDLRWHVDQQVPLPGRRELRKRWGGWSERAVRDLLADTVRWWDATKGAPPTSRGDLEARVQVVKRMIPDASRSVPGRVPERSRSESDEPTESTENDPGLFPDASRSDPGRVHARAPIHPAPSPSPSRETPTVSAPAEPVERPTLQLVEPVAVPAPRLDDAPTVVDALPSWARRHRTRAAEVADGVIRCLEAIRQRPVLAQRSATDAAHVLRLWEQLQRPPMAEFVAEVELVGRWAREAPGSENDIRGVRPDTGKVWGKDRSREVSTLMRPERWADRLADAQRWDEGEDQPYVRGEYRPEPRASPKAWPDDIDPDMPF